jgi:iron complex transport system substrate-binding protein
MKGQGWLEITALVVVAIAVSACGGVGATPSSTAASAISVTDDRGVSVSLVHPAARVVVTGSFPLDALAAVGVRPVGMLSDLMAPASTPQYYGPDARKIALISGAGASINLEQLAAAQPDLILSNTDVAAALGSALTAIAPLVALDPGTGGYQGALHALQITGALTGRTALASRKAAEFTSLIDSYRARAPRDRKPVLVMFSAIPNFRIATSTSGTCAVLDLIATCPWVVTPPHDYAAYAIDRISSVDPAVIFVRSTGSSVSVDPQLAADPFWQRMTAVRDGHLYPLANSLAAAGGTISLTYILENCAHAMYPSVYPKFEVG